MKIRTMLGLTLVGGALYAHKKHGGELTLDSFKKSFQDLFAGTQAKVGEAKDKVEELAGKAEDKMKDVAQKAKPDDATSFSTSHGTTGYTPGVRR